MSSHPATMPSTSRAAALHMTTTTLHVGGMTCGACTAAIDSAFKSIDGIGSVSVSLITERAVVQHDATRCDVEKVKETIEDAGFDAEVLASDIPVDDYDDMHDDNADQRQTTLAIRGMTCGACTSAVEQAVNGLQGISSFNISLLSERAVIQHDTRLVSAEKLVELIEDSGFDASIVGSEQVNSSNSRRTSTAKPRPQLLSTTVAIQGMTCGACTSAIHKAFDGLPGVSRFDVSLLAERAVISHDPAIFPLSNVISLIEDTGFDAQLVFSEEEARPTHHNSQTIHLKIYGLADQASADILVKSVSDAPGVRNVNISLSTSRATITHSPSQIGIRAIVDLIESAGYNALVAENEDNNAQLESLAKTHEIHEWYRAFRVSATFAIPVFLTSMIFPMFIPFLDYGSVKLPFIPGLWLGDLVCLLLTIPVQFGIGKRFYRSAWRSIKHGSPTMDVLVVLGTSAAFFFSCAAMLVSIFVPPHTKPATTFDTSTMLITFILLGRFLENRAKGQTSKALSRLMSLAPSSAVIYRDPIAAAKAAEIWDSRNEKSNEKSSTPLTLEERIVPTELLEVDDMVILKPGDKIPADGTTMHGESYVDESMVTGEAMPVLKRKGSSLLAGTVNGNGRLEFKVSRAGRDTQLSQIVRLVQEAQTNRAPIQRIADLVAGYFVPIIITLALTTFTAWMVLSHTMSPPPKVFLVDGSGGKLMVCVKLCIAVIVFACPCALGLATPTAVMVGTGVGAEQGILIKGGATLETTTKLTHVVFDKTGTLTMGKMSVADVNLEAQWSKNISATRLWWTLIGLAESGSEHPIARAILGHAKTQLKLEGDSLDGHVGEFESVVGRGISAEIETALSNERKRYRVLVGNPAFLSQRGVASFKATVDAGSSSTIYTAIDGVFAGSLSLSDTLKPSAPAAIAALQRMGIEISIVTGDQSSTAQHIASLLSIPCSNVHSSILPSGKASLISSLQSTGAIVAMVGDGINDSPALATSNVGISLSSGTDVAIEAADIVLMKPLNLLDVPAALHLSQYIFWRIKMNLLWACVYNFLGLPIAMGVLIPWGITLPPLAAGAAMACSSVTVVISSLLLRFWTRPDWMTDGGTKAEMETNAAMRGNARSTALIGFFWRLRERIRNKQDGARGAYMPLEPLSAV